MPYKLLTRAPIMESGGKKSKLKLDNIINIVDKDIGTLPYKGLQNHLPFHATIPSTQRQTQISNKSLPLAREHFDKV